MNRKTKMKPFGAGSYLLLFLTCLLMMAGGLSYILLKNEQVSLRREIDKVNTEIKEHEVSINLYESDISERLSYYQLREHLKVLDSALVEIEVVEVYREEGAGESEQSIVNR